MIEATQTAQGFIAGRVQADLSGDKMLLFAVVRAIEIIGEAAARISPELKTAMPDIPWAAIIGMRNRVVHAYFSIDTEIVWNTVSTELPLLLPSLHAAVDSH